MLIMTTKTKLYISAASLLIVAALVSVARRNNDPSGSQVRVADFSGANAGDSAASDPEAAGRLRTRVATREAPGHNGTHAPERLREFMLPQVVIDGLTLGEALRALMGVYEETCGKTGESPLPLSFDLPSGNTKRLHLTLSPRDFNSSVQLLATFAGMKVSRTQTEYHFRPLPDDRKQVNQTIPVPPGFGSALAKLAGVDAAVDPDNPPSLSMSDIVKASGLDLDPSTQVSLDASGNLILETSSSADAAKISALAGTFNSETPALTKVTSRCMEFPAGSILEFDEASQMTPDEVATIMRRAAESSDGDLMTMPSITTPNGQSGSVELLREVTYPSGDGAETLEKANVGLVMSVSADLLGFGSEMTVNFTDTRADIDPATSKPAVNTRTDLKTTGFSSDGNSSVSVQNQPDGSQTVLIITSQLIDATGRPVHGAK